MLYVLWAWLLHQPRGGTDAVQRLGRRTILAILAGGTALVAVAPASGVGGVGGVALGHWRPVQALNNTPGRRRLPWPRA